MKLLVAFDEDSLSYKVLHKAQKRAMESGAYVFLVHTCSASTNEIEFAELTKRLEGIQQEVFEDKGIQCGIHILVRGLSPGEDIVKYASEKNVDEIIIGIERKSKVGKLVFRSVAQYVILEAHCPVLTVNTKC